METITYGVTDKGFVRKPLAKVISDLNDRFTSAFGSTFDTSPESPDGQVIGIVGNEIALLWEQVQYGYNSYRPGAMQGEGLDAICELTGAVRYVNKPSSVTVALTGSAGSIEPAGAVFADAQGNQFVSQNDVTLPGDVTCVCTVQGEIYVAPNTVTKIVTASKNTTAVTNPEVGQTGIVYESDPALRVRRDKTTISSGTATAEAIYAALADMDLEYVRIRDNDTKAAIGKQPANTIWVVVDGGTVNDIARKIYDNKAGGVPTYGDVSVSVKDSKGYPQTIKLSRTTKVNIFSNIVVRRLATANLSSHDAVVVIQDAVLAYINTLQPGAPIVWSYLVPVILNAAEGIQVDLVQVGRTAASVAQTTIVLDINERPTTTVAAIKVTDATNT